MISIGTSHSFSSDEFIRTIKGGPVVTDEEADIVNAYS